MNKTDLLYLRESVRRFHSMGSIWPSSKHLSKRMVAPVMNRGGISIIELGAGTGSFTSALLSMLPKDGMILAIESNFELVRHLRRNYADPRLRIVHGDAVRFGTYLKEAGIPKVDYVISGLPIANMSQRQRQALFDEIDVHLDASGKYVQFQHFLASYFPIRRRFRISDLGFVMKNLPPAFVYVCEKKKPRIRGIK